MNEQSTDREPEGEGAMTGATGSLTPADSDEEFVPAERREIERNVGEQIGREDDNAPDRASCKIETP
jgi:hypothetical protein